jgi:hypothetical protein
LTQSSCSGFDIDAAPPTHEQKPILPALNYEKGAPHLTSFCTVST